MNANLRRRRPAAGRVWLITGASSGLGRAIAEAALASGDTVVAAVRAPASAGRLVAANPGRAAALQLDVADTARIPAAVEEVIDQHGRIDVLVNSAGRALVGAVEETSDRELRDLMEVHFFGPAALTRAALPHMRRQRSGAIVQISSMGGRMSFPGVGAYSASKFALEGLSEALAAEVAPFGIKVLIVEPGAFRTGLHRTGTRQESVPIPAYDDTVGPVRAQQADFDGKQPGDPAKAAAAILTALEANTRPLHLPLGNDAADAIATSLDTTRTELAAWEQITRSTDYSQ
ncbi:MAG: SDR family NAD(P)-dependent oxidoreductase [Microlunatus sp.]|nr:SDR family NAD(P)-dependent oxidoreductase [Microlunatus sp.]